MKYADKLEILKLKSWNNKYIDYKLLKKVLKKEKNPDIINIYNKANKDNEEIKKLCYQTVFSSKGKNSKVIERKEEKEEEEEEEGSQNRDRGRDRNQEEKRKTKNKGSREKGKGENNKKELEDIDFNYLFFFILENHINIVKKHYEQEYIYLDIKLNEIISFLNRDNINEKDGDILKKNCLNIYNLFDILNNYLNLNILSMYKILKKKNKKDKDSNALKLYQTYHSRLSDISKEEIFNVRKMDV